MEELECKKNAAIQCLRESTLPLHQVLLLDNMLIKCTHTKPKQFRQCTKYAGLLPIFLRLFTDEFNKMISKMRGKETTDLYLQAHSCSREYQAPGEVWDEQN